MAEAKLAHFIGPVSEEVEIANDCFGQIIIDKLETKRDQTLFVDLPSGREVTCGEVKDKSIGLANGLWKLGYKKGDCACVCSYNLPEGPIAFYGSDLVAMTSMWCNALYSSFEMNHQLKDSNSCLLFIPGDRNFLEKSIKAIERTKVNRIILMTDTDFDMGDFSGSSNVEILAMKDVYDFQSDGSLGFPKIERDFENDVATLLYSSGTTGTSKGVPFLQESWRYFFKLFYRIELLNKDVEIKPASNAFLIPPLFHLYGLACGAAITPFLNYRLIMQRRFNYESMLEVIEKYQVDTVFMLPAIMNKLVKDPSIKNYNLSSIKMVMIGAASLSKETIAKFYDLFEPEHPIHIVQSYGMTEGGATSVPYFTPRDIVASGTVGTVSSDNEVKIVDINTLQTLPVNTEGEIWTKSKMMMKGYLNRPEETAKTITEDGWLRTGDIGYFREDGYLFITDRLKELVKYKGYQVPPAELEAALLLHPDVIDAGVTGRPDEEAGQLPVAFVVLKPGVESSEAKATEIQLFVKEKVAPYKQLKGGVHFVPEIPRNAASKILRRKLLAILTSE